MNQISTQLHNTSALAELRTSAVRFRAVFDHAAIGIVLINLDGKVFDVNNAFAEFVGYSVSELHGQPFHHFTPSEDAVDYTHQFTKLVKGFTTQFTAEHRYVRRDGQVVWASVTMSRADGPGHEGKGIIAMVQDITTRKTLEARLTHQAFHDSLTNLANRALFQQRAEQALLRSLHRENIVVMFLDLDNFKSVNDGLGHAMGDELLTVVAHRLLNATRGSDTVARLGGDEFAILLSVRDHEEARIVADRVISAMREPITLHNDRTIVGISIGIAWSHTDSETADDLLRNADVAMYIAKARGKGTYEFFEPEMYTAVVDRLALETDLHRAVAEQEFTLFYQPLIHLTGGHAVGVEALVRWMHPTRGLIAPSEFISIAEETGLIVPLGRWVLHEACRQAQAWSEETPSLGPLSVAVNISGRQLQDPLFVVDIETVLAETGLHPSRLVLEITETIIMHHTETVLRCLRQLKMMGIRLAIDDFGTGYSSLNYLQQFPIDILKIDKAFVESLGHNTASAALTRTIIGLSDTLGLSTIAEGIEYTQQRSILHDLGCELGQGFLFAHPLPASEAGTALRNIAAQQMLDGAA